MNEPTLKERIEVAKRDINLDSLVMETTGATRLEHNIRCPFHEDKTPSLHVYSDGRWKCFAGSCGKSGDALDWLGYLRFGNAYDPRQHLVEIIDSLGSLNIAPLPSIKRETPALAPQIDPSLMDRLQDRMGQREVDYWQAQGIPSNILTGYRVGFTGDRYAFGWYYRNVLTAVKLRRDDSIAPDLEPKYLSMKGSRYSQPYNIDRVILSNTPHTCLIVEDEKSTLAAAACGIVAIAAPAGAKWDRWQDMLSGVERVIFVPDNDEAGTEATHHIRKVARRFEIRPAPIGKDLFDYHEWAYREFVERDAVRAILKGWLEIE